MRNLAILVGAVCYKFKHIVFPMITAVGTLSTLLQYLVLLPTFLQFRGRVYTTVTHLVETHYKYGFAAIS